MDEVKPWQERVNALALDFGRFFVRVVVEGERASVILGAARLERALENALKSLMRPQAGKDQDDPLFGVDRPLGSLSARIRLAYRLGVFGRDFESALHALRKIRNDFAHSPEEASLSTPIQHQRLHSAAKAFRPMPIWIFFERFVPTQVGRFWETLNGDIRDLAILLAVLIVSLEFFAMKHNGVQFITTPELAELVGTEMAQALRSKQ